MKTLIQALATAIGAGLLTGAILFAARPVAAFDVETPDGCITWGWTASQGEVIPYAYVIYESVNGGGMYPIPGVSGLYSPAAQVYRRNYPDQSGWVTTPQVRRCYADGDSVRILVVALGQNRPPSAFASKPSEGSDVITIRIRQ